MPIFFREHRTAVDASVQAVAGIRSTDLDRATPCAGWTLADLLAHMTAQHRGFAAAARGHGADADVWRAEPLAEAIADDPVGTYTAAARDAAVTMFLRPWFESLRAGPR